MVAEIQGLSAGGGAPFLGSTNSIQGLATQAGVTVGSSSSIFPAVGHAAAGSASGGVVPGVSLNATVPEGGHGGGADSARGSGSMAIGASGVKSSGATNADGEGGATEPLSPRNREYRNKMVEMEAQHRVSSRVTRCNASCVHA